MVLPLTDKSVIQCINRTASPVIQERLFVFYQKEIDTITPNSQPGNPDTKNIL